MMSQSDVEEKHVIKDKAVSQEDISRPSSSIQDEFNQQNETVQNHEPVEDKDAQIDARSTMTTESAIPPPPDGGLHAWLKVFGGFMIYINIWYVKLRSDHARPLSCIQPSQTTMTLTTTPGASP